MSTTMDRHHLACFLLLCSSRFVHLKQDNAYQGRDFMVVYYNGFNNATSGYALYNFLYIHSEQAGNCTLDFKVSHTVQDDVIQHEYLLPGRTIKVPVTQAVETPLHSQITPKGVHITCSTPVAVYAQNRDEGMSNVYHGIPYKSLSNEYYIPGSPHDAFLSVAGLDDETKVQIQLKSTCNYTYKGTPFADGDTLSITLDKNDVFELSRDQVDIHGNGTCDLAGSYVKGDKPFAVFSGATCLSMTGNMCDQGFVQVPPPSLWGKDFVVSSIVGHHNGYEIRIQASDDDTHISIHVFPDDKILPSLHYRYSLQSGDVFTNRYKDNEYVVVQSTKPVLLLQYLSEYPIIVTPISQYPNINDTNSHYVFSTMERNEGGGTAEKTYAKVIVGTNHTNSVQLNKRPIVSCHWVEFPMVGLSLCQTEISRGSHLLDSTTPDTTGAVQVYSVSPERGEAWGYSAVPTTTE